MVEPQKRQEATKVWQIRATDANVLVASLENLLEEPAIETGAAEVVCSSSKQAPDQNSLISDCNRTWSCILAC